MKKLFLSFAVIAGMSMISCGNKAADANDAVAEDTVAVVEEEVVETVDTLAADTAVVDTVAAAATEVAK